MNIPPADFNGLAGTKVLIADDDQTAGRILSAYCKSLHMPVVFEADSGQQAWDWLSATQTVPEIIISDLMMPGLDGCTLAAKVKEKDAFKTIQLMAVSSEVGPGSARRAKEAGFDALMHKPISHAAFAQVLHTILGAQREAGQFITHPRAEELSCKDLKILAVEDNVFNRKLIDVMLKKLGCQVELASNGQEGVDKVRSNSYDLILMDLQMPAMGGLDATRIIRNDLKMQLPIIAFTAAAMKEDEIESRAAGMDDFLTKPINAAQLKEKILQWTQPASAGTGSSQA